MILNAAGHEDENLKDILEKVVGLNVARVCYSIRCCESFTHEMSLNSVSKTVDRIQSMATARSRPGPMSERLSADWTISTCRFYQLSAEFTSAAA